MRSLHALRLVEMTSGGGPEGPHGVEHGEYGHTYVGKHGKPHRGDAKGSEDKNCCLDTDGEHHVLTGYRQCAPCDTYGKGNLRGLVVHQHHVGTDGVGGEVQKKY